MQLVFIRHGLAEGHFSTSLQEDFSRELTKEGENRLHEIFHKSLHFVPRVDVVFSSPLIRAIQTAEIYYEYHPKANLELMADLDILDDPQHLVEFISFLPFDGVYAFIGHDPHLTRVIASLLLLHPEHDFMKLKKGGICVLRGENWDGFRIELVLTPKIITKISF